MQVLNKTDYELLAKHMNNPIHLHDEGQQTYEHHRTNTHSYTNHKLYSVRPYKQNIDNQNKKKQ